MEEQVVYLVGASQAGAESLLGSSCMSEVLVQKETSSLPQKTLGVRTSTLLLGFAKASAQCLYIYICSCVESS